MASLMPYQERVIQEKRELDEKADRLAKFLNWTGEDGERPDGRHGPDLAEMGRLRVQHAIMDAYAAVLAERIDAFTRMTPPNVKALHG